MILSVLGMAGEPNGFSVSHPMGAKERRTSHLLLDREELRDLIAEHRDGLATGWAARTTVHCGPRWQVALVTFVFVLVTGGGALLVGSTIGAESTELAAAGTSEEQMALRSAPRFFDALSSGDPEQRRRSWSPRSSEIRRSGRGSSS